MRFYARSGATPKLPSVLHFYALLLLVNFKFDLMRLLWSLSIYAHNTHTIAQLYAKSEEREGKKQNTVNKNSAN